MKSLRFTSNPARKLRGETTVPGDKSISHRSIIFGAIAEGTSNVTGFLDGEDCLATIKAFRAMGVRIEGPEKQKVIIHGVGKYGLQKPDEWIDCGNSGTSMRLLCGLLAAQRFDSGLTGDSSLVKRPMARIIKPLTQMGAVIKSHDDKAPLLITGGQTLQGIEYHMPIASAQVKSCLLLAGLYAEGETRVYEPEVTRDHSERMLKTCHYPVQVEENRVSINNSGALKACNIEVPGDISSAAFLMVAASIVADSDIIIRNVGINSSRTGIIHLLQKMGANITLLNKRQLGDEPVADIQVQYAPLKGIDIPEEMVPLAIDEFPVLFIAAACAKGTTRLTGAEELRSKESDRIGSMMEGLQRLGIQAEGFHDGAIIQGGHLQGGQVNSYGDHRIAMAFAVAGAAAKQTVIIDDCENVRTSFPHFVRIVNALEMAVQEKEYEIRN